MRALKDLKIRTLSVKKSWVWFPCLAGAIVFLVISFGLTYSASAAEPQYGAIFRSHITPARSYDPHMETWPQTTAITLNTYNGLLRMNKDMTGVELDLAESWKQIDDLAYEFKLRQGAYFHDISSVNGRELTSSDVKYGIERIVGLHGKASKFKNRYYFECS